MPVALPLLAHTVPVLQADVEEAAFLAALVRARRRVLKDRVARLQAAKLVSSFDLTVVKDSCNMTLRDSPQRMGRMKV